MVHMQFRHQDISRIADYAENLRMSRGIIQPWKVGGKDSIDRMHRVGTCRKHDLRNTRLFSIWQHTFIRFYIRICLHEHVSLSAVPQGDFHPKSWTRVSQKTPKSTKPQSPWRPPQNARGRRASACRAAPEEVSKVDSFPEEQYKTQGPETLNSLPKF